MDETKVKAIVLGAMDYKEKDMLCNLFTLENGIVTVLFKGVKNANAKLKSAKEMFSFGDFIYASGNQRVVTSAEIIDSFHDITKNINKYYCACAIVNVVKTILQPEEVNTELFVDVLKCLKLLCYEDVGVYTIINKLLIRIFEGFGYQFTLNACNNCGEKFLNHRFINLQYGDITCYSCRTGRCVELSAGQYNALRLLALTDYESLSTLKIDEKILIETFNILNLNFENRFGKKVVLSY